MGTERMTGMPLFQDKALDLFNRLVPDHKIRAGSDNAKPNIMNMKIFFIDDNPIERMKFKRVMDKLETKHSYEIYNDAMTALDALLKDNDPPNLVLVDLNMPAMDGVEFISCAKADERFHYTPFVVLSSSGYQGDVVESYGVGAVGYIEKPVDFGDYKNQIRTILEYWGSDAFIFAQPISTGTKMDIETDVRREI